ncbi:GON-4-like protein [Actinia tenebrosa]|uniref:GON-4-like protein n=1 Tax=Actinia tenebrosa TaxID=6105 RepID=A0A6P8IXY0_ACTTE|nr:GON-4-like protein [Actinia tenebrosa]
MPKSPKGKKRKVRPKKEKTKKHPKRLKFEDDDGDNVEVKSALSSSDSEEDHDEKEEDEQTNLERMLEKNAKKNNLTAINVKSILHHVVTDKRVRDLVQKVIAEETAKEKEKHMEDTSPLDDIDFDFEPKMTRSKFKQRHQDDPIARLTKSPIKSRKPASVFTDLDFPESSSDEEYDPEADEEDEDTESCLSHQSDLASPFKPASPDSQKSDTTQESDSSIASTLGSGPFTRHRSQETIFKKPDAISTVLTPEKEDLIAKRTRSHLPLKENLKFDAADFMLPDYMPDLYDTVKLDDLDKEDIDFQLFLQRLINGEDEDNATEDEDKEYDYMAENHKEEKEEYRNDRAVRIPKQEVSDLFEELLNECDENGSLADQSPLWSTRGLLPIMDGEETSDQDVVLFSEQQRAQLSTQMNQHVQLLSQVFLLSREDPTLQDEAEICRQYVNELQGFSERASSAHYMMALESGYPCTSMFEVPGLSEAIRIANEPFNAVKRPRSPRKQAMATNTTGKNKLRGPILLPVISSTNQTIMASSILFHREELLPRHGFTSKDPNITKDAASLRVKFTETEDNLLALGIKQFQRNWKMIQTHLLPVKTPKQLQIRCKNLLSNRAQMNVVKNLRQTNSVWKLPTKIRPISSPDVGKRYASSDTPDWLVLYRQKLKNSRKHLTPKQVQPVHQRQTDTLIPSVPNSNNIAESKDVPRVSNSGIDVAKATSTGGVSALMSVFPNQNVDEGAHSKQIPNDNDTMKTNSNQREQPVKNFAVKAKTSNESYKNANGKESEGVTQENNSSSCSALNLDTITISQETTKDKTDEKRIGNETSTSKNEIKMVEEQREIRNPDIPQADKQTKIKPQSSEELSSQTSPGKSTTGNPQPPDDEQMEDICDDGSVNFEPVGSVENEENMQCTSSSTDNQDKTLVIGDIGSHQGSSEITSDKAAKSPPVTTATKTKGARDKSTITTTSNSVPSATKKICADPIPLDPDPKEQVRSQALADSYMAKVKKTLKNDPEQYEEFLGTLVTSSTNQWTSVQLYHRIEVVLSEYPELVEDFIAFLEPEEALEAGVLMENLEFVRARTFLRRLEVHFHKTPSHFKKIIKAFSSWNAGDKTPTELHEKIIPLLRGQQHLIDEFQSFFDNLKPPVCSEEDFEEVEIGSGSDPEVDDFEEVVIPKGKTQAKLRQTSATTRTSYPGNRQKITPKPTTIATSKTKQDQTKPARRRNKPVDRSSKTSPLSRDDVSVLSEGEEETSVKRVQGGGPVDKNFKNLSPQQKSIERPMECDESSYEQNPSSVRTDGSASDGPLSVASSLINETSNDSLKYEERDEYSRSNKLLIHQRTTSTDDVIDDISNDVNESENDYSVRQEIPKTSKNFSSDAFDDVSTDVMENENDDNEDSDNYDEMTYEGAEDEKGNGTDLMEDRVISARNHLLGQDGRLIVLWTREDDRTILSVCHDQGATLQTFEELSRRLTGKSALEIKTRFEELMKLFQADSKEPSSSEEEDEEEDSEGSEPETDS